MRRISCRIALWAVLAGGLFFVPPAASGDAPLVIDGDQQFRFAEQYFLKGEFYKAIAEYERFIHFFPQDERVEQARFRIGESYFKGQRYNDAVKAFNDCIKTCGKTDRTLQAHYKISEAYVALKHYDKALATLGDLLWMYDDPAVRDEALYRRGWVFLETEDWQQAEEALQGIRLESRRRYRLDALLEAMKERSALKTKNPGTAGVLAILPGAGHLYCERYQDALVAFLLNGAMILAAYEAFDNDNEALGGLLTFFEIGLYSGNIYSAVNSAHKYNRRQKEGFFQYLKQHTTVQASAARWQERPAFALTCTMRF